MNRITRVALIVIMGALQSACFHKSDDTGAADDIAQAFICRTAKGTYLVTHEEIFHATSKSVGGGGSRTTGYADYRLTSRDLATGRQIARLVTGDRDDDLLPLGYDGTRLWCYGADKSVGLQALDPATLKPVVTKSQVEKAAPPLAGNLAAPALNEASRYYGYDPLSNRVVASDMQGNLYTIDPSTLRATPTIGKPPLYGGIQHASSTSAYRWGDESISLSGSPRRQLANSAGLKSGDSYLDGEILVEQDLSDLARVAETMRRARRTQIRRLQRRSDSMVIAYPALRDEVRAYRTIRDASIPNSYYDLRRDLGNMIRDSADENDKLLRHLSGMVLGCDSGVVYIAHAHDLSDTSLIQISRVAISDGTFTTQWTTPISGVYAEPSKAIKSGGIASVFSAGNPEFDYEWYGIEGKTLVGIRMLTAFAIDVPSGRLLWKERL
jgi:hypothetical protein